MKLYIYLTIIGILLISCSQQQLGELYEIKVEIDQNNLLFLSDIAEEVIAIELELTDESLINPDQIVRFVLTETHIILAEKGIGSSKVLAFNKNGKFVQSIGARGHGPGEFNFVNNIAFDDKNKRLFVSSEHPNKIICYNMDGKMLRDYQICFSTKHDLHGIKIALQNIEIVWSFNNTAYD